MKIHDFKSRIKGMQKLYNKNKTETAVKDIIKNFVCLNYSSLTVLMNILKFVNNLKSVTNFVNSFNHICENINIIYQLITQFLLLCCEGKNWVSPNDLVNIKMMINAHHEADDTFL